MTRDLNRELARKIDSKIGQATYKGCKLLDNEMCLTFEKDGRCFDLTVTGDEFGVSPMLSERHIHRQDPAAVRDRCPSMHPTKKFMSKFPWQCGEKVGHDGNHRFLGVEWEEEDPCPPGHDPSAWAAGYGIPASD